MDEPFHLSPRPIDGSNLPNLRHCLSGPDYSLVDSTVTDFLMPPLEGGYSVPNARNDVRRVLQHT